jgi:regulator of sigma E protease
VILTAGGDSVHYWQQLVHAIESHAGESVAFTVRRGDSVVHLSVVPEAETVRNIDGTGKRTVGKIGIGPLITPRNVTFTLGRSFVEGGRQTWGDFARFWTGLAALVAGHASTKDLASPILIGEVAGERARLGLAPFLAFMALISVNLAGLNILPIPLLDGGHILFLSLEAIRRKPVSLALRLRLSQIGLVILLAIAGVAVVNDLVKLWG